MPTELNISVGPRVVPRLVPLGRLAPGGLRDAALALTTPTSMRVIHCIHSHTTHLRDQTHTTLKFCDKYCSTECSVYQ